MLLLIFGLGEIFSILATLYIIYFGTPHKLFTNYDSFDGWIVLAMIAVFSGWITFPFFIYATYKQIELNNKQK